MTKKVIKVSDVTGQGVEVGILTDNEEVIFHEPIRERMTCIALYYHDFYIQKEDGEYCTVLPTKTRREVITYREGIMYSLGYIDCKDSVVFYDQYL
jgi:hypothetical protein